MIYSILRGNSLALGKGIITNGVANTTFSKSFHLSSILCRIWKQSDDKKLLDRYNKYGPSWTFLSFAISHRTPDQCRKRILHLTGRLDPSLDLHPKDRDRMFHQALEFIPSGSNDSIDKKNSKINKNNSRENDSNISNQNSFNKSQINKSNVNPNAIPKGHWHPFPPTPISPSPYLILASKIRKKTMKERWNPQWTQMEVWTLREGYDQWGDNWTKIARRMPRRTAAQCRRFMTRRYEKLLEQ